MSSHHRFTSGITVLKIGGSLARVPQELERVCRAVSRGSARDALVVVPGGGPLADAVRELDTQLRLSPAAAHWMAILAMDQYAYVLADRITGSMVVEEPGAVMDVLREGHVAVLAPSRWMRSADVLPHSWDVTSDSIAAFVAGALGATRLVLIKPPSAGDSLDPEFLLTLPAGMPHLVLSWDQVDQLSATLRG